MKYILYFVIWYKWHNLSHWKYYTHKQSVVGFFIIVLYLFWSKIQNEDFVMSVIKPPLTNAPEIATSFTFGTFDVTVTPSEQTGLDGSSALL